MKKYRNEIKKMFISIKALTLKSTVIVINMLN